MLSLLTNDPARIIEIDPRTGVRVTRPRRSIHERYYVTPLVHELPRPRTR